MIQKKSFEYVVILYTIVYTILFVYCYIELSYDYLNNYYHLDYNPIFQESTIV